MTKVNYISVAKKSAAIQIKELKKINKVFNKNFVKAVDIIHKAKGKVVDSNFTIPKPGEPNATLNPVVGISNYDYETRLNEKKSNIFVLREEYLQDFLDDMRNIMTYQESSEYLNDITIQTENTNITLA